MTAAGIDTFDEPVELTVTFYRGDRVGCDLDNLVKLVSDGLNKLAFTDDKLVERLDARLHRATPAEWRRRADEPRTEVSVRKLR
jgi:Holliday junction resolvase RusA-like endonuclease